MNTTLWFRLLVTFDLLALGHVPAPAAEFPVIRWEGRTMGSPYTVQIVDANLTPEKLEALQDEVERQLREVNRQMSHYQPDSELSRFNGSPANVPFKVSPEFARVVRFSLELCDTSGGAFDPTMSPVINLWGFGEKTQDRAVPPEADLKAALQLTGCKHLSVTPAGELIKDLPGLRLNLSAVAKGFGVDEMIRVLRGHGLANVYASIAGEVRVLGHNPRGAKWNVGISAPLAHWRENDPMAAVATISNQALSTSGDYQKFFTNAAGQRLSHILNPKTGQPVQNTVVGVTTVAADSMTADALATTLFVLGPAEGRKFIDAWKDAAALFITRERDGQFKLTLSTRFTELTGYHL